MRFDDEKKTPEAEAVVVPEPAPVEEPKKQRRGFAAMDRAKVRAIARRGGQTSHARGTAHRFTAEEARAAGKKGGMAPHRARGRKIPAETPATENENNGNLGGA